MIFLASNATPSGEWEAVYLNEIPAEEKGRILRDLFGETENDCE